MYSFNFRPAFNVSVQNEEKTFPFMSASVASKDTDKW